MTHASVNSTEKRLHFGGINFVKDFSLSKSGRISFFKKKVMHIQGVVVKHSCSKGTIIFNKKKHPIYLLHKSKSFVNICISCKESNSTANEGKRQFNISIIYYLNIVPIVNDSFWQNYKKI